ncbi:MAG: TetR family transcriptional regulator [Actinobacteria bacterium]|nr:TetR family transcriptional regulator [Actinomycetota bacterium]
MAASGAGVVTGDPCLWEEVKSSSARRILRAALESFAERGYHATTTRQISERADLSPTAMYAHYGSKMDLLAIISEIGHRASLAEVEAATAGSDDVVERVRRFACAHAAWHARNHTLARVLQYELHTLPAERFVPIRALRRDITQLLRGLLETGAAEGVFKIDSLDMTTVSVLSLGIDVSRWYSGRPDPVTLARTQADLVMRMLGAPDAGRLSGA